MSDASQVIAKAIWKLGVHSPFFGAIAIGSEVYADESIPTMCTDGKSIRYNPEFVLAHSVEEIIGVMAHEVCHIAFKHPLRIGKFPHKIWNMACDYAINPIVIRAGKVINSQGDEKVIFTIPEKGLVNWDWEGKSAEEIAHILMEEGEGDEGSEQGEQGDSDESGGSGDGSDQQGEGEQSPEWDWGQMEAPSNSQGEALSEAEREAMATEIDVRVLEAHTAAQKAGKVPAGIDGLVTELLTPKVDWQDKIQNFVGGTKPDDYTFSRPNRKMLSVYDVFMPSSQRFGAGHVVVLSDSSGSCHSRMVEFFAELTAISEDQSPDSITVITFDTQVQDVREYGAGEQIEGMSTKGGGGTRISPAFKYVEDEGLHVDSMIVFTDLYLHDFPDEPDYPVLWCTVGSDDAPWGEVVRVE